MDLSFTIIIIVSTAIISLIGFSNPKTLDDLLFFGPAIKNRNQYYRFLTHGLVHADLMHLVFNMFAFYSFGNALEKYFYADPYVFGSAGKYYFLFLYLGGLIIASFPDYLKHQNDYSFRSLGASGAVSAVIFACIVLYPTLPISIIFFPVGIPGWIFGLLYLGISYYLDRRGGGRINHGAHLWGAIFGLVYTIAFVSLKGKINLWQNFVTQISS